MTEVSIERPKRRGRRSLAELRATRGTKVAKINIDKEKTKANSLGSRVRLARKRLGLSQQELAGPEYVASYISAIERDKIHPSLKALQLIATRLGEPVEYFLYGGYGSGALAEQTSATVDSSSLSASLRDNLTEAQILLEQNSLNSGEAAREGAVQAEQILNNIPRHQLTEYDRAILQELLGLLNIQKGDYEQARVELEEASQLAAKTGQASLQIEIKNLRGNIYFIRRQIDQALLYHREAWEEIQQQGQVFEPELKLRTLSFLANDYLALGRQDEAVATFNEALKLDTELAKPRSKADAYLELAESYRAKGDLYRARRFITQAYMILRDLAQRRQAMRLSADIGDLLANMGRDNEAEQVLSTAMVTGHDDNNLTGTDLALTFTSMAWLRLRQGRIEEAQDLIQKSIQEARAVDDKIAEGKALKLAAEIETRLENRVKAQEYFDAAIACLEQANMAYLLGDIYKSYGEALEKWGDFAQAVNFLKKAYESKR